VETNSRAAGRRRDPQTDVAIIQAVLDLLVDGATLSGLSLVMIAKHAGVSRNSLYRRWQTKDALYLDVLDSINRPLPEFSGATAFDDVANLLAVLVERMLDRRASRILRSLIVEADAFPDLHRSYFEEIVLPRREAMYRALRRGVASGEVRSDIDVPAVAELLVGPILSRLSSGVTEDLDPKITSQHITELVFEGVRPR
jgi:AcrR family transcriptional regulator